MTFKFDEAIYDRKKALFFEVRGFMDGAELCDVLSFTGQLWDFLTGGDVEIRGEPDLTNTLVLPLRQREAEEVFEQTFKPVQPPVQQPVIEAPLDGLTGRQASVLDEIKTRLATGQSTMVVPMVDTLKMTPKEIRIELTSLERLGLVKQGDAGSWLPV